LFFCLRSAIPIVVGILVWGLLWSPVPAQEGEAPTPEEGSVRCTDCDEDGKVPCPTCAGKRELTKPCELCRGSGLKACPVCTDGEETTGVATPGRVPCDYCKGKGTISTGKTCPRCEGAQSLGCTSCGSKGKVTCRKTVVDKVCPTCRFAGKVTCPTCEGTLLVKPGKLAQRRLSNRQLEPGSASALVAPSRTPSPASSAEGRIDSRQELDTPADSPPTPAEVEARFKELKERYESHLDIFADDPRNEVEASRSEALKLVKRLPKATRKDGSVAGDLIAFAERAQQFRARWGALREVFDQEHKTFTPAQRILASREERLNESPKGRRAEVDAEILAQIGIALRVAEKRSQRLEAEEPAWVLKEKIGIESEWKDLKARGEAEVEALEAKEKAAKALADQAAQARKAAREASQQRAEAERRASQARRQSVSRREDALAASGARSRAPEAAIAEPGHSAGARRERPNAVSTAPAAELAASAGSRRLVWSALLILCGGCGALWLVTRQRKPRLEDESPPAVS